MLKTECLRGMSPFMLCGWIINYYPICIEWVCSLQTFKEPLFLRHFEGRLDYSDYSPFPIVKSIVNANIKQADSDLKGGVPNRYCEMPSLLHIFNFKKGIETQQNKLGFNLIQVQGGIK